MDTQDQILERYTTVDAKMTAMLAHAQQAEWDELVATGQSYVGDIAQLAELEDGFVLDDDHQNRKNQLVIRIRDSEAYLRSLLEQRAQELSDSITELERQRKLNGAYTSV